MQDGHAASRCAATAQCTPCDAPPLVANRTYGPAAMPISCTDAQTHGLSDTPCVAYATPAWDRLVCTTMCIAGHTATTLGECAPCTSQCGPGTYAPPCVLTGGPLPCLPCPNTPPANAYFSAACATRCSRGFYNRSGVCAPCNVTCTSSVLPFALGCTDDNPGFCVACYNKWTTATNVYWRASVWDSICTDAPCSVATQVHIQ